MRNKLVIENYTVLPCNLHVTQPISSSYRVTSYATTFCKGNGAYQTTLMSMMINSTNYNRDCKYFQKYGQVCNMVV